jgi:hypothetical protein
LTDSGVIVAVGAARAKPTGASVAPAATATIHVMSFADFKAVPPVKDAFENAGGFMNDDVFS